MSKNIDVIVGLGVTGVACARFLKKNNILFAVNDTRCNPPQLAEFKKEFPEVAISLGQLDRSLLKLAKRLIVSPGISIKEPEMVEQIQRGIDVIGDIELFAQTAQKPIVAITGT